MTSPSISSSIAIGGISRSGSPAPTLTTAPGSSARQARRAIAMSAVTGRASGHDSSTVCSVSQRRHTVRCVDVSTRDGGLGMRWDGSRKLIVPLESSRSSAGLMTTASTRTPGTATSRGGI